MSNCEGLLISGVCRGIRPRMYDGKVQGYELGVVMQVNDGFGGTKEDLKIVRVNENQHQAVQHAVDKVRGKSVLIHVYESAFAGRNGAIAQLNYAPDSPIHDLSTGLNPFSGELKVKP